MSHSSRPQRALRFLLAVACLLAALTAGASHAAARLVIGAVPGMVPPLDVAASPDVDADAAPRGVSVEFAQAVAESLGMTPQWRRYPNRGALIEALSRGEIDMATGATGGDPGGPLLLSRPYLPIKTVIVEPLAKHVITHRMAYVETQTSPARLAAAYPSTTPAAYPDTVSALLAVSLGQADAFAGDVTAAAYCIGHLDLPGLAVTGFAPFDEGGYSFAFAAGRPDAQALAQRVDAALARLPPRFMIVARARWEVAMTAVSAEGTLVLTPEQKAWIAAHPVVYYSMLSHAPPLMFRDARGQPAGLAPDLLAAVSRMTGLRFEARQRRDIARIERDVKTGESAFLPISVPRDPDDPDFVASVPFGEGLVAIVTRSGAPPLADAAALAGKRVALPSGYPAGPSLREQAPAARIVDASPGDGQLAAVANGKADATVLDTKLANYAIGNPYRGRLAITGVLSSKPSPHVFLVARNQPVLLDILNRAIAALPPHELEAIRARWQLTAHPETLWEQRRPRVELGAALGGALLLVLAAWAVSLRAQIVRRIAAENAMRAAKEEAETANRAKSTFLATMSHEIRTPMNAVLGLIELELRAPGNREATERSLRTAHHAARDLLGMIDDLLDVAKIEAERLVLAPSPVELFAWIASVAAIYEPAARAKGIALVVERHGERDGPAWIVADAQRLRQIVGNLLSNAIKFTDAGAVTLACDVAPPRDGKRAVTLVVSDTGVGIAPERQASLFTPFVQAHDGGARRFGGTGLGLTICKRLVSMMGGSIAFASTPGQGTRFTVRAAFPEALETVQPQSSEARGPAPEAARALRGLRVLVVDDHPANRMVLDGQIRLLGGSTELAVDGRSAFACWRDHPGAFDVILTDCSMPEMSGEELAEAIRADEATHASGARATPIVGLTANAQPEAARRAVAAGMTMCLVKPIGLDALRDALAAAAGKQATAVAGSAAEREAGFGQTGHIAESERGGVRPTAPLMLEPTQATTTQPTRPQPTRDAAGNTDTTPPFDSATLATFGDQAATLLETLRSANAQDLEEAHAARNACDHERLREIAHRMKGAAAVIGAARFKETCVALQRDCDRAIDEDRNGEDDASIDASFAAFERAALTLDAALDAAVARPSV
ncbi:transporter substrate-binding domain-containing protein [Caballeronia sp. BCC1704]|uniref:ATP-binding protein n=1 Tax=Caballeronia sp. BCC1704 TaxID=2676300 RepID=UPI001FC80342|nr:transporter substrate-binding domain-containing protein [Caballeronia sp. BCC1704]